MKHTSFALIAFFALIALSACGNLRASLLGGGDRTYTASYTDSKGQSQSITVVFTMQDTTIQEFHMTGEATGAEHGHQLAAEANARKYFVGKVALDTTLPSSVGDEAQAPVTGALKNVLEQLQGDL